MLKFLITGIIVYLIYKLTIAPSNSPFIKSGEKKQLGEDEFSDYEDISEE